MERELPFPTEMRSILSRPSAPRVTASLVLAVLLAAPAGHLDDLARPVVWREASHWAVGTADAQTRTRRARTSRRSTRRIRSARPATPPPIAWTSPRGSGELSNDFARMIDGRVRSGKFGVMVVSLTRGDTLFARSAGDMMQPASTMKLYATAAALDRFGPEHRNQCRVSGRH